MPPSRPAPSRLSRLRGWIAPPLPPDPPAAASDPEALRRALRRLELASRRRIRDGLAGDYRSAFRGAGLEIADLRAYAPGDDVRGIDWRASARRSPHLGPVVRRYVEERARTVLFLLDASASMGFGRGGRSVAAYALELLAPLAFAAAETGDRAGLLAFSEETRSLIAPAPGRRAAFRLIREALALEPRGGTGLAAACLTAARLLKRRSVVVILSDFNGGSPAESGPEPHPWRPALARLAARHDVIAAALADPYAADIPAFGRARWSGLESRAAALLDARSSAAAAAEAERRRESLEPDLRAAGAEPLMLEVGDDWLPPLAAIMRRRR